MNAADKIKQALDNLPKDNKYWVAVSYEGEIKIGVTKQMVWHRHSICQSEDPKGWDSDPKDHTCICDIIAKSEKDVSILAHNIVDILNALPELLSEFSKLQENKKI